MICAICYDVCDRGFTCLECDNTFHDQCVDAWWERGSGCPLCRFCIFDMMLRMLVPDIPDEVLETLSSHEKRRLCKLAIIVSQIPPLPSG
jgi:hypothetical protein